jgi:hypothetical protein
MLATRPDIETLVITRTFDGMEAATHRVISQRDGMALKRFQAKFCTIYEGE